MTPRSPLSFRFALLWALLPAVLLAACGGDPEAPAETAEAQGTRIVPVEVVEVTPTTFEDVIQMTGTVEAPNDATLSAEAAGTLRSLTPLGAAVGRGQTVAQIDAGVAQAQVRQAEASLEAARAQLALADDQFRRQEPLYRDEIISALEFESVRSNRAQARAQVAQAEASLAQTREQLSRTRVIAPFSGTVEEHLAERGEQVAPGTPVVRIVSTDVVTVRAGVPERYAGDIRQGTPVLITPQAYGLPPVRGQVSFVGQTIDPQSRTFPVEVRIDNRGGQLKPQMTVRVEITRQSLDGVLAVPLGAVVRDERGPSVVVIRQEATPTARTQPVTLGSTAGGMVVVTDGLAAGDLVVTQGQTTVADGDPVRIAERHTTRVLSATVAEG